VEYFEHVSKIAKSLSNIKIKELIEELADLKKRGGRLFFIGVGGSAANCSHAVNDFRKLANIEAYTPVDNISEITARTNDEGWSNIFSSWLKISKACERDAIFVLSVGGGDIINNISPNIVTALDEAKRRGMSIYGIIGREEGYTNKVGDIVIVVPCPDKTYLTPLVESFQSLILHYLVSHPKLKVVEAKWESVEMEKIGV